jgi:hypothetical protein
MGRERHGDGVRQCHHGRYHGLRGAGRAGRRGAAGSGRLAPGWRGSGRRQAGQRLIIPAHVVDKTMGDFWGPFNPVATPDGSKVFATAWTGPPSEFMVELVEFSAQTGRQLAVVIPPTGMPGHGFACVPLWTDPSGAYAIATCGVTGTIDNGVFTPTGVNVPGASGSGIDPLIGIAW